MTCGLGLKKLTDLAVAETADVEFTAHHRNEDVKIIPMEEVESAIGALIGPNRTGDLFQIADAIGGIINGGEELDIATVCVTEHGSELRQAVDGLFERRIFQRLTAASVYHLTVVFEERDIVGRSLDTKGDAVFVVHLDSGFAHMMLDACALDACVEIIAEFILEALRKFAAQKHGDLFRFDCVHSRADKLFVQGFQFVLTFEHDVGGVFNLHETPMISSGEPADGRTINTHSIVQRLMQAEGIEVIGEFLRQGGIIDMDEGIVMQPVVYLFPVKLLHKSVMAVAIELQPEGSPCGHAQIAQTPLRKYKVEIVVQTLPGNRLQKGLACLFVMPRLKCVAGLHGRKDMHQPRMISTAQEYFLNAIFLAEILPLDEIDCHPVVPCDCVGVCSEFFAKPVAQSGYLNMRIPRSPINRVMASA